MPDPLQRLVRELQKESCPPAVFERVAAQIARERPTPSRWLLRLSLAIAGAVTLAAGIFWLWPELRRSPALESPPIVASVDHALVRQQTQGALIQMSHALAEAAARAEDAIVQDAVAPLLNSFLTSKDKLLRKP